jgi:PHP family Zn ribbon phosphoesterase
MSRMRNNKRLYELDANDLIRAHLFLYVPTCSKVEYLESWLTAKYPNIHPVAFRELCSFHVQDKVLAVWRMEFAVLLDFIQGDC